MFYAVVCNVMMKLCHNDVMYITNILEKIDSVITALHYIHGFVVPILRKCFVIKSGSEAHFITRVVQGRNGRINRN